MILLYHNIVPENAPAGFRHTALALKKADFIRHAEWLASRFNIVPLDVYLQGWSYTQKKEDKTISITFDDGLASTFECILPVIQARDIPVTIFAAACHLNGGELIWGSYLNALCYESIYEWIKVEGRTFHLRTGNERTQARQTLAALARREGEPVLFCRDLANRYPLPAEITDFYQGMTQDQLQTAGKSELIELGAHSVTHADLDKQTRAHQAAELTESRRIISEMSGISVRYFAYPSGAYNLDTLKLIRTIGYQAGFAVDSRRLGTDPRFEIERTGIYSSSLVKLHLKAAGLAQRLGRGARPA